MCFEGRLRPRTGPPEWRFCCGGGLDLFRVLEVLEVPGPRDAALNSEGVNVAG